MKLARPEGFEPPTTWFVARYSIQLSYGRPCLHFAGRQAHRRLSQDSRLAGLPALTVNRLPLTGKPARKSANALLCRYVMPRAATPRSVFGVLS